jgi:transposase
MTRPDCIPSEYWDVLPTELRPGRLAIVAAFEARIAALDARIAELEARLNPNSSNSSRPPSSDPPGRKPAPPRKPSGRKRGGQPGHRRNDRIRLESDEVVDAKPDQCRRCGEVLAGDDPEPIVRQVFEVPVVRPRVVEYRLHRRRCPRCGESTCGVASPEAATGYGPRAQAACAVLAGEGRMSKRRVAGVMRRLFGLPIGPASVWSLERRTADALAPIHGEALEPIRRLDANVDETSWRRERRKGWLWTAVAKGPGVFQVAASRSRDAFKALMGRSPPAVVTSDRYSAYSHLPPEKRQACWAHLRRDFRAMIDRGDAGEAIGEERMMHSDVMFAAWSKVRAGTLARRTFAAKTLPWLRRETRRLLKRGAKCGSRKTAATCREVLKIEPSLWTFARVVGVEPTNNAAERAPRHAVCWRKTRFGTDSEAGSRFVERMLTAIESCRRQGRDLLDFLVEAIQAHRSGGKPPSLVPTGA